MPNKIIEKIVEPSKIVVGSNFLIKVKVQFTPSYQLVTENNDYLITEDGDMLFTEGDYYEQES